MSSDVQSAANKKAALEQLRFSKSQHASRQAAPSSATLQSPAANLPPPQLPDATLTSRFFPVTPSSPGNILVPNSSPLPDDTPILYEPYGYRRPYDVAVHNTAAQPKPWSPNLSFMAVDPLSAPSGLMTSNGAFHSATRRQWSNAESPRSPSQDEGPPRKRLNRGQTEDAISMSPPAQPHRPISRPRTVSDAFSVSSEDSLPDVSRLAATSNTRIFRKPSSSFDIPTDPFSDPDFIKLTMTMPGETPTRVKAAWTQSGRNFQRATALMTDPSWIPSSPSHQKVEYDDVGRVKEVEEANRAQKMAAKEKGKKSMIYANRLALETKAQATPKAAPPLVDIPNTPATPVIAPSRRKRLKKLVIDSDSEAEAEDSEEDEETRKRERFDNTYESRALDYLNITSSEGIQELTGCSKQQADTILKARPFDSVDDLNTKLGQGKKKAGPAGISPRLFEDCTEIFKGYGAVDSILEECERIGSRLRSSMASWGVDDKNKERDDDIQEGALSLRKIGNLNGVSQEHLTTQPALLAKDVTLKEYQLLGVNWLNLLYNSKLSCILADEMGLGKTAQVISFLAHLKESGNKGPHLVVVPSSTLENWCREFARFAPSIAVQTYYAGKGERPLLRETLLNTQACKNSRSEGWEVLITTYTLAQGDDRDRKFFRKIDWNCCIYDEGHVLKNFQSQRYQSLLKFGSRWRVLLTGTPLQNNLQELVSLMNFILPDQFADTLSEMRAIFKVKGDSKITLLSQERVSRAKKMMTPFVLRRRKDQVLQDLPQKTERIEWCEMTELQRSIYTDALHRSRRTIVEMENNATAADTGTLSKKTNAKTNGRAKEKHYTENSTNVLMDLRKAASHPMLFRKLFTDDVLSKITKQLLKEPDFKKRGALYELVKEDMSVMTDAELQLFCKTYKSTKKFLQKDDCYLEAGKVNVLLRLLDKYEEDKRKILIFSQFTQILDILQAVFNYRKTRYLVLTGSTPVDVRQTLVDEFTEDESIPIFLLSTKAGGMGINLTAASVVIMFDQDFNPHNDKQAQDRAYRIGQKRDVEVIKLISRGTIEEDMLKLGQTKLALDEAVAADPDEKGESAPEREMKTSLMNVLRQQFEKQQDDKNSIK